MNANKAFKTISLISCLLLSKLALAEVDTSSEAYQSGHSAGKIVGYIIIGIVIFAVVRKFTKK